MRKEAEERMRKEAEERARREAEEKKLKEEREKREAEEERMRKEAEIRARKEAEERARKEAEERMTILHEIHPSCNTDSLPLPPEHTVTSQPPRASLKRTTPEPEAEVAPVKRRRLETAKKVMRESVSFFERYSALFSSLLFIATTLVAAH